MRRFKIVPIILVSSFLAFACSKPVVSPASDGDMRFSLTTKAGQHTFEPGTTCRILFGYAYSRDSEGIYAQGTYVFDTDYSTEYMRAARLDNVGNFVEYDDYAGIDPGHTGAYYVVYIVPGYQLDDTRCIKYIPEDGGLWCMWPGGASVLTGNGTYYPPTALRIHQTKLGVHFFKSTNESVPEFTISNPRIVGTGNYRDPVRMNPLTRNVYVDNTGSRPINITPVDNATPTNGRVQRYTTLADDYLIIAPGFYRPHLRVTLDFTLTQGNKSMNMSVKLNESNSNTDSYYMMSPMYVYDYNVVVMSNFLEINMDVYDFSGIEEWELHSSPEVVAMPSYSVNLGRVSLDGWQSHGDLGNQPIMD